MTVFALKLLCGRRRFRATAKLVQRAADREAAYRHPGRIGRSAGVHLGWSQALMGRKAELFNMSRNPRHISRTNLVLNREGSMSRLREGMSVLTTS
jgi:hypothetical protein